MFFVEQMFDSFEEDYENELKSKRDRGQSCVVEEEDEAEEAEYISARKRLCLKERNDLKNFNHLVNSTYNQILNEPFDILKCSDKPIKNEECSLKKKLFNLYLEESNKTQSDPDNLTNLNYSTHLLEKLVDRERLNTLVLNFYPLSKGYSLGFNIKSIGKFQNDTNDIKSNEYNHLTSMNKIETKLMSYDQTELLYYINAGEIPPIIIDLVDRLSVNLYKDGCIILEIRDYRRKAQLTTYNLPSNYQPYDLQFILLQPSMQTLLADLNSITNDGNFIWTQEDKYTLESQLILATAQPLCLNPSPIVSILKHKFLNHKYKLNDRKLKRTVYKFSSTYLNRSSKWNEYTLPLPFHIQKIRKKNSRTNEYLHFQTNSSVDGLNSNNNKQLDEKLKRQLNIPTNSTSPSSYLITSLNFQSVDNWSKNQVSLTLPREDMILVKKFAKNSEKFKFTNDQSLVSIEEIILEAVDQTSKNNYSKLLIKRRPNDEIYFCQLSLCIDQSNNVLFRLGLVSEAEKYIQQYIKIFTEEGRRQVTITKNILNAMYSMNYNLLKEHGYSNEHGPSAFTSLGTNRKQLNNLPMANGNTFQSYFNKKNQNDCNDKQLQTYQKFLYQQQQQQLLLQKQQMQSQQMQQHMHVQQQLHSQIKRIKSSNDDQMAKSSDNNSATDQKISNSYYNLVQNSTSQLNPSTITKVHGNSKNNSTKSDFNNKNESFVITSTSPQSSTGHKKSLSSLLKTETHHQNTTHKTPITSSKAALEAQGNNTKATSATGSKNFVQIYVPKIASTNLTKLKSESNSLPTTKSSQALPFNNVASQPTKKAYAKKRACSSSSSSVSSASTRNSNITETEDVKKKQHWPTTDTNNNNINTTAISKEAASSLTTKSISMPNTKIINASNLNLLRKIAIDSRSMPVIVTLNSGDSSDLNQQQQQTIQHQLKLKSQQQQQQQNKQIKLVNSRVTLKPAITNSNNIQTNNNESESTDNLNPTSSGISPIKTFQFQKSSPMLKQLSFSYNSQNIKTISPSSHSSSNTLNTIPINNSITNTNSAEPNNSQQADISSTKFLVTSSSSSSPKRSQARSITPSNTTTSNPNLVPKPSFVIKKNN